MYFRSAIPGDEIGGRGHGIYLLRRPRRNTGDEAESIRSDLDTSNTTTQCSAVQYSAVQDIRHKSER